VPALSSADHRSREGYAARDVPGPRPPPLHPCGGKWRRRGGGEEADASQRSERRGRLHDRLRLRRWIRAGARNRARSPKFLPRVPVVPSHREPAGAHASGLSVRGNNGDTGQKFRRACPHDKPSVAERSTTP